MWEQVQEWLILNVKSYNNNTYSSRRINTGLPFKTGSSVNLFLLIFLQVNKTKIFDLPYTLLNKETLDKREFK